jgi:hypothetical protein
MFLSFVKALERKTGKLKTLAEIATATYDQSKVAKVIALADAFDAATKQGAELRKAHSHMICVITNSIRCNREYADIALEEEQKLKDASLEAERIAQVQAQAAIEEARASFEKARQTLLDAGITPPVEAELKAHLEALQTQGEAKTETQPPVPKEETEEESDQPPFVPDNLGPQPPPDE